MWAWGQNAYGNLGLNNTASNNSPVQIGALTTWSKINNTGDAHTAAIKTDGTLWTWGKGADGKLGLGSTTDRSSPVQVGALTNWLNVSAGYTFTIANQQ